MKENKLILMQKKIEQLTNVVNGLIQKLQQVDIMSKGTLTAFQLYIGEAKWKELVNDLQAIEKTAAQPEEKKFETDVE
jgi:division protein CdvB (Snf7/Vps24/ESCRT-III family)